MPDASVLFVCAGNTCRSPLAEAVARDMGIATQSAGVVATDGAAASAGAQEAAQRAGLDVSAHVSCRLDHHHMAEADVVYTMTADQATEVRRRWPQHAAKVHRLDPAGDVVDPFGGDAPEYAATLVHIESAVRERLSQLI